ncbi:MAG: family 78 glycoside hydrolase catalytic domain [Akkermansiaceae bacterium]|nr:family 78 glycoside hydrolase catalytic domain [Armatimonadota bacterium]
MPFSRYDLSHVAPDLRQRVWTAKWTTHAGALAALNGSGVVLLFRKSLSFNVKPERFVIHVSADQRYRLYVNGNSVGFGPARGDLMHWRYETFDIAPYLTAGENIISARVHFFAGENAPVAQATSGFPAFLVQGGTEAEADANTPNGWRVAVDDAYSFTMEHANRLQAYAVVGPSEFFDAARHPADWNQGGFDDSGWSNAASLKRAAPYGTENAETHWWLVPRTVPLMEETPVALGVVRSVSGAPDVDGKEPVTVPANRALTLLLDHGMSTCGFPMLRVSGGAGSTITLGYAEALQEAGTTPGEFAKNNRDETEGKVLRGYVDTWKPDGSQASQTLDTLWWRTFRFAELTVTTTDTPLLIDSLAVVYTGYPWDRNATFDAPEVPELSQIREVGWRTLRLCSHETFMDCPYYEQLQYAGDTRIQALASLYETGDPRLFRNALMQFDDSRAAFGLTMSRYPSRVPQVITPFSLWWVCMVHDYLRHVPGSAALVRSLLPGVRSVLEWFTDHLLEDDLLGPLPDWNFVDWCDGWQMGVPPGAREGGSSIIALQLVLALQAAAELCASDEPTANGYARLAKKTLATVRERCLENNTMLIADTPEKTSFSQHGNLLAILAGMGETEAETRQLMARTLDTPTLTQATFYFRFYLGRALIASGAGDQYLDHLQPWHDMLALGLTTWAEKPEPTRSDCHAWSSSPNYEFLAGVLGITPSGNGWASTQITPHLGNLTTANGSVPVPGGGVVSVSYRRDGDSLYAMIALPELGAGSSGTITWRGETHALVPGRQTVVF